MAPAGCSARRSAKSGVVPPVERFDEAMRRQGYALRVGSRTRWRHTRALTTNEEQHAVVRRHFPLIGKQKTALFRLCGEVLDLSQAPFGVPPLEIGVERQVGGCGWKPLQYPRSIKDHLAAWWQHTRRAVERKAFLRLVKDPRTLARMETMLETGKPLRN